MKNNPKLKKIFTTIISYFDKKAKIDIDFDKEFINISIESEDPSILIGYRGETLHSLEYILRICNENYSKAKITPKLLVDINNYKKRNVDRIKDLANKISEKVIKYNQVEVLPAMNSYERRIVHISLKDNDKIICESVGIEPDRRIIVKPK